DFDHLGYGVFNVITLAPHMRDEDAIELRHRATQLDEFRSVCKTTRRGDEPRWQSRRPPTQWLWGGFLPRPKLPGGSSPGFHPHHPHARRPPRKPAGAPNTPA